MVEESHYKLSALRGQPLIKTYWANSLELVMSRLNALESFLAQPLSEWYTIDSNTNVFYGAPQVSVMPHMRIKNVDCGPRLYLRDRVEQLRVMLNAHEFEWKHTPDKSDFDNSDNRCGIDARQLLELLQAIGRGFGVNGNVPRFITTYTYNENGNITTEEFPPVTEARAGFSSTFTYNLEKVRVNKSADWGWSPCRKPTEVYSESGDFEYRYTGGGTTPPLGALSLVQYSSKYYDTIEDGGYSDPVYDWVEQEGISNIQIIGDLSSLEVTGTESQSGVYHYSGGWGASYITLCSGNYSVYANEFGEVTPGPGIVHSEYDNYSDSGSIGGPDWVEFEPEFVITADGSVSPVIPTDLPVGTPETISIFWDNIKEFIDEGISSFGGHVNVAHLKSAYDRLPHGTCRGPYTTGDTATAGGSSTFTGNGSVSGKSQFSASYVKTHHGNEAGGWLLWDRLYIPTGFGGWPENLKDTEGV